jgi:hypothetical protein
MKLFFTCAALLVIAAGQQKPQRYTDAAGGFSFAVPQGWQISETASDAPHKTTYGPRVDGYTPNITVEDDAYPGSLQEYVEAAGKVLETNANSIGMKSLQLLEKSAFVTAAGLKGYKLTHTAVVKDIPIIFRRYVFERSNQKQLIFTCTSLTATPEIGAVCDAAMKTVTLED